MYISVIKKRANHSPRPSWSSDMTKTPDFTKVMQDMMASFPVDASAFQNAFKTQAAFAEKFSKVAIEAAEKSTEISAKWTKDALAKVGDIAKAKAEPTDGESARPKGLSMDLRKLKTLIDLVSESNIS